MGNIYYILFLGLFVMFFSCKGKNQFEIKGIVDGGHKKTIYLERNDLNESTVLDSCIVNSRGEFKFIHKRAGNPGFYNLRYQDQMIRLVIDSTESIYIRTFNEMFGHGYSVEGSLESKQICALNRKIEHIKKVPFDEKETSYMQLKAKMKEQILERPNSLYAYYCLFLKLNGNFFFNPYDNEDFICFQAVANQLNQKYPDVKEVEYVSNLMLSAMKLKKSDRVIEWTPTREVGSIDISLLDKHHKTTALSSLKGKVVLLDFTNYSAEFSPEYNTYLASLHENYKDSDFEIYQVALDHYKEDWMDVAVNLPWVCVHDEMSFYSNWLLYYNVTELPTCFLLDKEGNIVGRDVTPQQIEELIAQR